MDINFKNKVFIDTDYMGEFYYDQHRIIGWQDYANGVYYSPDEVKQLFLEGKAGKNVRQRENGELYMYSQHCSSITVGTIVCGILVHGDRNGKNKNLYDYAEKQGWITNKPIPIKMTVFTKELQINEDDTYNIVISFDKNKFKNENSYGYLEKICVGAIKKLKYSFCICHGKETTVERKYYCKEILFDKDNLQMIIKNIPKKHIGDETHTLRELDIELAIMTTDKYNSYDIESASITAIRDDSQYHWLNESESKCKELSNIFWFDKNENYYKEKVSKALKRRTNNMTLDDWDNIEKGTKIYYKQEDKTIFGYFAGVYYYDGGLIIVSKIPEDDYFSGLKMKDKNICVNIEYDKVKVY